MEPEVREIVNPLPAEVSPWPPRRALAPDEGLLETLRQCLGAWDYPPDRPVVVRVRLRPEHRALVPTSRPRRRELDHHLRRAGASAGSRVEFLEA